MALALFFPKIDPPYRQYFFEVNVEDLNTHDKHVQRYNVPYRLPEKTLDKVEFNIHKFNNRPKPKNRKRVIVISCFSEFGCETIGCMYCIPRLVKRYPGLYIIAMGWHGREYLYRHLVDEFWEVKEDYMWLRDYTRAFHHISSNLKRIEEAACHIGSVMPAESLGNYVIGNSCRTCGKFWSEWKKRYEECPACGSTVITRAVFTDLQSYKKEAIRIPKPSDKKLKWAKSILKPKTVGIFARGRKTYGRNLKPDFYVKLISLLESMGYNIIWLGEKQSTQPCPVDHVLDFSRMEESRDLENTLAIIANLSFTVQFWTASTRLAGMMGTPFLLFESPEQIYSSANRGGQEGCRLELASFGPKKLCISHFNTVCENPDGALELVEECVEQMKNNDFSDVIGLVENKDGVKLLRDEYYDKLT